jgi:carbonic anhydrase/acetyltransferase-like protein (isoleucine patch superfamily)
MAVYRYGVKAPSLHPGAYISEHAVIIGDVEIHEGASVWPGAVLRGDNERIVIGRGSNVQDGAVIHADPGFPVTIGEWTSIGHQAMLHGCTVGNRCLIGIQAVLLNAASIGDGCLVGAGALIGEGKVFANESMLIGAPARLHRSVSGELAQGIYANALAYCERGQSYARELVRLS